jgi:hypothetical protein
MNGHLDILQWARSNECPWNRWTRVNASTYGHYHIENWARDQGCPE